MIRVILLLISVCLSAVSSYYWDIYYPMDRYHKLFEYFKIFSTGFFFSLFCLYLIQSKGKTMWIRLFFLLLLWHISFLLGYGLLFSGILYGILVAGVGFLSGWLINGILIENPKNSTNKKWYIMPLTGFFAVLIGIGILSCFNNLQDYTYGFRLMWIVVPWQIGIGSILIQQKLVRENKVTENNNF